MNLKDFLTTYAAAQAPRIQARPQPAPTRTLADFLRTHALPTQQQKPRAFQPGTFTNLLRGVDLFAGAGGFTIGSVDAGLPITLAAEFDAAAVQTSRRAGHAAEVMDVGDVGDTDQATLYGVDVIIGGPPCQPFSSMGARAGKYDPRDGFPLVLKAIERIEPKRVVFENVKGFLSPANKAYRDRVMDDLAKHFRHVGIWQLNAKDFGVPQDRERVFIWGAEIFLDPPVPTHGPRAGQPYRSVAQALPQLGAPAVHVRATTARSRSVSEPAPTVTTKGTLYTAAREGLVYGRDPAKGRRLTVPELSALQGFPGAFEFTGRMGDRYKQVGNAVPPPLGEAVVRAVLAGMRAERMKPSRVLDLLKEEHPEALLLEPRQDFDRALIGITNTSKDAPGKLVAVYDRDALLDAAMKIVAGHSGYDLSDPEGQEDAFGEAYMWLDSIESGMQPGEPNPILQRRDPDQMDLDEEALYQQGSENRWRRRRPVRRLGWLSA
jgi:DNA (cytosine-5)-methyltransferase 1